MRARQLHTELGYKKWENFYAVIKKAIQLSKFDSSISIVETRAKKLIGSGAQREIIDYEINEKGIDLIKRLCGYSKPIGGYKMRNETFIIHLLAKYYEARNLDFCYQYQLDKYRFDCKIGDILFEYDEPHHINKRQTATDANKNNIAAENNFKIVRATPDDDIIDIILRINSHL